MVLIYLKNIFFSGRRDQKIYERIQNAPITSIISLILDFRDLIDLEEKNNFNTIMCIWCNLKFFFFIYIEKFI